MKIYVRQVTDEDTQQRVICGFVEFEDDNSNIMRINENPIELTNGGEIFISSAYDKETKNISVFAREKEIHIFTGFFNWDYIATNFAFRSVDGVFTELFFEK
jgi:hypothetical protein